MNESAALAPRLLLQHGAKHALIAWLIHCGRGAGGVTEEWGRAGKRCTGAEAQASRRRRACQHRSAPGGVCRCWPPVQLRCGKPTCEHALLCGVQHTWQREDGQSDERGFHRQGSYCQPLPALSLPHPQRSAGGAGPPMVANLARYASRGG